LSGASQGEAGDHASRWYEAGRLRDRPEAIGRLEQMLDNSGPHFRTEPVN